MANLRKTVIRTGLETLYFTGMHHWLRPLAGGVGAILTLHHVRPARPEGFQPNRLLEVTPDFLEGLLRRPLAEAHEAGLTPGGAREALGVITASYEYHGGFRLRTLAS